MKRFIQTLLTVLLTLGTSTTIWAAPPKGDCPTADPAHPEVGVYERLECRQLAIAKQMAHTSDEVFANGTPLHGRIKLARLAHLKNGANKAGRAAQKNDAKAFKRQARALSRGNKGTDLSHLVPLNDYADEGHNGAIQGDGICDYEQGNPGAKCAAIEVDQNGDLQACNPDKKNKGKGKHGLECDRFVEDPDEIDMGDAALNLDESYSATEDDLREMNIILEEVNVILDEPVAVFNWENGENEEDCTDGIDNDGDELIDGDDPDCMGCDIPEDDTYLIDHVRTLREIQASTFGAARIATDLAGQDILGSNALAAAAFFDSAALAANVVYVLVDEERKEQSGIMQKALMKCSEQTINAVAVLLKQVQELKVLMQQEHEAIVVNDDENTTEIIQVLNTPHGQRDKFRKP